MVSISRTRLDVDYGSYGARHNTAHSKKYKNSLTGTAALSRLDELLNDYEGSA
jgi:hypothetical protein